MKKLIVANWKMNPGKYDEADKLAAAVSKAAARLKGVETVLCPPFLWLECLAGEYAGRLIFGAQDVFWEDRGAYTGEISAAMLKAVGAKYVIIGHSERRRHLGETDEMINKKVRAALGHGIGVILCVGETLREHQRGQTKAVLRRQLRKDLADIKPYFLHLTPYSLTIAYEPIWAIGTGLPETPANADAAAAFIRSELYRRFPKKLASKARIIYGGSVNSRNIIGYLGMRQIVGALVGGASLDRRDFVKIMKIADAV